MQENNWQESNCRFLTNGKQCTIQRVEGAWFCKKHQKTYVGVCNQDLLEQHATTTEESLVVKNKRVHLRDTNMNGGSWDDFYNTWHELTTRGYIYTDIRECTHNILEQRNFFAGLMKQLRGEKKWRKFEKLVAGIHLPGDAGAIVKFDDTLLDKRTGLPRQIDVSVSSTQGFYRHLAIIECKDKNRKVTVEWIEGFRSKIEDVGAQKGVMVSPLGFSKGAAEKAKSYGIELFTLTPQVSGWSKRKRQHTQFAAIPCGFSFDCPSPPEYSPPTNTLIEKVLIRCNSDNSVKTLLHFAADICERETVKKTPLPTEVKLTFGSKEQNLYAIKFQGSSAFVPLYGLTIKLKAHPKDITESTIDMPPRLIGYIYKNVLTNEKYKIRADDIPRGVDTVLKPGEYYTDKNQLRWRCISIEDKEAVMWLMNFPIQGQNVCIESKHPLNEAYKFVPLDDSTEQKRLEEIYQSAVSKNNDTES